MKARVTITLEDLMLLKADARGFSLTPRQPVGSLLAGRHASRLRGRGLMFEELRHYHQGDDIRLMDWKATARLRSPHVRVYSEERERPVLMVVDQRSPMFFGSRRAMKSVAAAEVAALGSWRALDSGDRVGGLVFNDHEIAEVRPHRSQNRVLQLFHQVVRLNKQLADPSAMQNETAAVGQPIQLNAVLEHALQVVKHDHLVVVISDLDGADDQTQQLTSRLASHNDVLIVAVYDPLGISINGAPGMLAHDRGRVWEISNSPGFRDEFQATFQRLLDHWKEIFHGLRVPVLPISTASPVAPQIRSLFGNQSR
ncbi:DUF58 domain-containing protein [Rosistilla oblonga]|uniref:DUF58 domain-containing protein n=1 Tax=Rosistilla oblonga TaxID=2527990 RepID=UPI003A9806E3